ncbi:hypothetical protein [Amycolatopsis nigrescens]|uniref:hypothetical protein n=1 Tax=Amycolatopsis nigrescens TaxID=381445 RepID=UPI0003713F6D|nr:hypothetical protein [Amycolatopsis nigrescens]
MPENKHEEELAHQSGADIPDPVGAADAQEYVRRLNVLRVWVGRPSIRRLSRLGGHTTSSTGAVVVAIPPSTISRILRGRTLPALPRMRFVDHFVSACLREAEIPPDVAEDQLQVWRDAWRKLALRDEVNSSAGSLPSDK